MRADDDGFVDNPKKIIKIIGANDDDLKILITKGFVIVLEKGIIVITHWKINNFIRKDRYKSTMYIEQKQLLYQIENGAYISEESVGCHLVNQRLSSGQPSIDKGRLDKVSIDKGRGEEESPPPTNSKTYGEFHNVNLSDEEYQRLKEKLKSHTNTMIEKLSRYMQSSGKTYQDHYATLLHWYEKDEEEMRKKTNERSKAPTIEEYMRGDHL